MSISVSDTAITTHGSDGPEFPGRFARRKVLGEVIPGKIPYDKPMNFESLKYSTTSPPTGEKTTKLVGGGEGNLFDIVSSKLNLAPDEKINLGKAVDLTSEDIKVAHMVKAPTDSEYHLKYMSGATITSDGLNHFIERDLNRYKEILLEGINE